MKPKEPTNHRPPPESKAGLSRETAAMVGVGCDLVGGEESQGSRLAVEAAGVGDGGCGGRRLTIAAAQNYLQECGGEGKRTGGKKVKKTTELAGGSVERWRTG
jgi:hypothetical protein